MLHTSAVLSGALQALTDALFHPIIVVAAFIAILGGSAYQVAVAAVAAGAAWGLTGLLLGALQRIFSRALPIVLAGTIIRVAAALLIAWLGLQAQDSDPEPLISTFLIVFVVYQIASALSSQNANRLVMAPIPSQQWQGLFTLRRVAGSIIAIIAALAAVQVFRTTDLAITERFGLLFVLGGVAAASASWFLVLNILRSPPSRRNLQITLSGSAIRQALSAPAVRRYLGYRMLLALTVAVDPFLVVLAIQALDISTTFIGWILLGFVAAHAIGSVGWSRLAERQGARITVQLASLLRLIAYALAVAMPPLIESARYQEQFTTTDAAGWVFVAIFAALGLSSSAHHTAGMTYLLDITPARTQNGAVTITNATMGVFAFAAFGVAWLLTHFSIDWILVGATGISFVALLVSGALVETRPRVALRGPWRARSQGPRRAIAARR